jgi:hypothetical protein
MDIIKSPALSRTIQKEEVQTKEYILRLATIPNNLGAQ